MVPWLHLDGSSQPQPLLLQLGRVTFVAATHPKVDSDMQSGVAACA